MKSCLFILLVFMVCGCATLSKEQCQNPDWQYIGDVDGRHGYEDSKYRDHVRSCGKKYSRQEEELYLKGWNEGIQRFCTAKNGYHEGVFGLSHKYGCDPQKHADFYEQVRLGEKVRSLRAEQQSIANEKQKNYEDQNFINQAQRSLSYLKGESPDKDLNEKNEEINKKIRVLENHAEGSSDAFTGMSYYVDGYGRQTTSYLGAYMGSIAGFGIGHALQGRYLDEGWKWTLGEIAAWSLLFGTAKNCQVNSQDSEFKNHCQAEPVMLLSFLAFRIWQGYDLWSYANRSARIYAAPTTNGIIIGYRF